MALTDGLSENKVKYSNLNIMYTYKTLCLKYLKKEF